MLTSSLAMEAMEAMEALNNLSGVAKFKVPISVQQWCSARSGKFDQAGMSNNYMVAS